MKEEEEETVKKVPDTFTDSYGVLFLAETRVQCRFYFRNSRGGEGLGLFDRSLSPSPMATSHGIDCQWNTLETACRCGKFVP